MSLNIWLTVGIHMRVVCELCGQQVLFDELFVNKPKALNIKSNSALKHSHNTRQSSLEFQRTSKIPFWALLLSALKVQKAPGGIRSKVILESDVGKC
jgi:hypothetical protein